VSDGFKRQKRNHRSADQQRLSALRAKLRRINGHKELSPKQAESAAAIVREIVTLDGTDLDELSKLFQ
jgi:hypothetical protein